MTNNVVLVAPRPVRVSSLPSPHRASHRSARLGPSPTDAFAFIKIDDNDERATADLSSSTMNSESPRTSPRPSLSSDALEEFLSILRPSLFPTGSPPLRARRHGSASLPPFPYERPHPYKTPREKSHSKHSSISSIGSDDGEYKSWRTSPSPSRTLRSPILDLNEEEDGKQVGVINLGWRASGVLESPISRSHTRNPFHRHPSYEIAFTRFSANQLSPALMPLPPSPGPLGLSPVTGSTLSESEEMET